MPTSISRRRFLRAEFRQRNDGYRPPWALPERDFLDVCNRCGACAKACPVGIIRLADSGYPRLDFRAAGCTFCRACVSACAPGALGRAPDAPAPWRLRAHVGDSCLVERGVQCRLCDERCEAGAIHFVPRLGAWPMPIIDAGRCSGCGACVGPCPVDAILLGEPAAGGSPREAACT